jgi:beta-galactosidase
MFESSRRQFLKVASLSATGVLLKAPLHAADLQTLLPQDGTVQNAIRLDSGWEYRQGAVGGVREAWVADQSGQSGSWGPVTLPHCFNGMDACDPDTPYYRGQGWYRTRLTVNNPLAGGRTLLHFQGAGQTTTVWVGKMLLGTHKGGYDEFAFDITDAVAKLDMGESKDGVPVTVLCDNSPDLDRVPSDLSDFCLYGGLYRHVNLVYLPAVALDSIHIRPKVAPDNPAEVGVSVRLYNPTGATSNCALTVEVLDPQGTQIHRSLASVPANSEDFVTLVHFGVNHPRLWSPDTPNLYRCRVTLSTPAGETRLDERFGMRSLEFVENGPFKLNGERLLLRGTQRHADHAGVAAAMSDELVRKEMRMIRDMGANFIRLGHYQQDRLVLDLCDELGLMVWEEAPWCRAGIGGEAFQQHAHQMLTHMIEQHYNHPSIILWGLGNEDDWPGEYPSIDKEAIRTFMTGMRDLAHQLDHNRLTSFRRCDIARDIPDVYSPSLWDGWYKGDYHDYEKDALAQSKRVKRFIHIEWGADSHAGRHAEDPDAIPQKAGGNVKMAKDGDFSESYACRLFDWHLKTQEKLDWLTGSAQWAFKDFATPLRSENPLPRMNQKGLVERDLTPKESYYVFQSFWSNKPMARIYGHSWPIRWGREGELRTVQVYSNCTSAEIFLNGVSLGTKKRNSQDYPAAGLRWQSAFRKGENRLRVVAAKNGVTVTDELSFIYQCEQWGNPSAIRLVEKARHKDTQGQECITVQASLYDAKGVMCLDAATLVGFTLTGAGRLIDNLGTVRASRELQLANGRAEITLIRSGSCRVEVTPQGLPAAALTFS